MSSREPRSRFLTRALIAGLGVLLCGTALPGAARAEGATPPLYQWTDESGNVRYTPDPDRVPSGRRSTLLLVVPDMQPTRAAQRPAVPVSTPPVATAPAAPAAAPIAAAPPRAAPPAPAAEVAASAPAVADGARPPAQLDETPDPFNAASERPGIEAQRIDEPLAPGAQPGGGREQELLAAIAADEAALEALISAPPTQGEPPLAESAPLREIALRLPQLQAELRALREQRAPAARP